MGASIQERQRLADQLRAFIERSGKTQRQVADELGVDESYVSKLASGSINWTASRKFFVPLVHALSIRPDEVAALRPDVVIEFAAPTPAPPTGGTRKLLHTDKVEILVFAMASATPEGNCSEQPPSTTALVSPRYARPNHCAYLVDGDSMDGGERPIRHGDVVIVDRGLRDLVDNRIYVVKVHGNGILLKRVRLYDGVPELQSDNRAYRTLRPDEAQILGMVVKVAPQEFDPY